MQTYKQTHTLIEHKSPICSLFLTAKGPPYLLSASVQKLLTIHNSSNGNCIAKYSLFNTPSHIQSNASNELIFVAQGNKLTVMNVKGGERVSEYQNTSMQKILCMSALDQIVICGTKDAKVHIFDLVSRNRSPIMTMDDCTDGVSSIFYANNIIACSCFDGKVRQYDIRMGKLHVDSTPDCEGIGWMSATTDGNGAILSPLDDCKTFRFLDLQNGQILNEYYQSQFNTNRLRIETAVSRCGNYFFAGDGFKCGVWCWDILEAKCNFIQAEKDGFQRQIKSSGYNCVAAGESVLVAGGVSGEIAIWHT